jgi:ABC-type Fe3+/spermidine/putrescine transport system ATPase subunit
MSYLQLQNVVKRFGEVEVVKNLSLDIKKGELMSFLGPSGCGKTTTLNMIAGFIEVDGGSITVDGKPVHHLPPYKRNMGMVFQSYALFPHMTVFENIAFGLKLRKVPRPEIEKRVQSALEMTRLDQFKNRYPKELSGGQQQRVAISRALAIQPTVLLLDEPLSNLDAKLRREMREEIVDIRKHVEITMIFVTHDQEEALAISDRIAVMNAGKIEQVDVPQVIYNHPQTAFVAGFIGEVNRLPGKILGSSPNGQLDSKEQVFYIRPEKVKVAKEKPDGFPSAQAKLERKIFLGSKTRLILTIQENPIIAEIPTSSIDQDLLYEEEWLNIYWQPEDLLLSGSGA